MKKGIIVLLITVLVAGFAFAGTLKGSAGISFKTNFDEQNWGFANPAEAKYSFSFDFDTTAAGKDEHSTDIWAEIAAEASAGIEVKNAKVSGTTSSAYSVAIKKANIHVNDITFGILDAGTGVNFAKSYYKVGDNAVDNVKGGSKLAPGFTFAYKQFKGGFGATGTKLDSYKIFAHAEIDDFKIAEDKIAVSAGIYGLLTDVDADKVLGGSVKFAFAQDKLSADVAADLNFLGEKYEIAANAKYDFVTANVYAYIADGLQLDAKLGAEYKIEEVNLKGFVDARSILDDARKIEVQLEESTTVDALTFKFVENYKFADKNLSLTEECTYKADKFTASAKLEQVLSFGAEKVLSKLGAQASVTSTAIVENAELKLAYNSADLLTKKGSVEASATISF